MTQNNCAVRFAVKGVFMSALIFLAANFTQGAHADTYGCTVMLGAASDAVPWAIGSNLRATCLASPGEPRYWASLANLPRSPRFQRQRPNLARDHQRARNVKTVMTDGACR